jgi:hypothetical protein
MKFHELFSLLGLASTWFAAILLFWLRDWQRGVAILMVFGLIWILAKWASKIFK